jgi:hypothetical protein
MNSLVKALIQPLLEANQDNIALVPGGFKPPTLGHFYLVDQVANRPEIDKVIVLIGHKTRDGVTKEESKAIWDIYQKYLPSNVEIQIADNSSPISDVGSLIKNNPQNMYYPVVGIRGEMDLGDLKRFDSMKGKYDNFKPIIIKSEGEDRISGTNTRAALIGGEKERFQTYLPTELSDEEKDKVWNILQKTPLNEMYAEPSEHDYPKLIKSLTEYMLDKGMNISPLPKVKFVDDDIENARDFFGKTAYYDPNNRVIVLYTMERHPKDVMRSFAHEMIHHMQNCDDRLGNITTQNTNEEGDLPEIEREAYEKGNMTFRNWTDTLTEGENKSFHINEYNNTGPSTPKVYIVKADGTYKEAPIKILSKISNLTYDMGGGETNFFPEKNIVIVDNIPVEQFAQEPGEIKDEKIYIEYNLNQPYSFPKANKILASQLVYHLDDIKSFAKTVNDSLKDGGTFQFFSDKMFKIDKEFLNYLSSEYGFGLPKNLNQYKSSNLSLKKGDYNEPVISYIYNVTDANGNTAKISVTKEGRWWKYDKIEGNIDFKPNKWSVEPEYKYNDITPSKENVLDSFSKALETDIVDFKKLNENKFPPLTESIVGDRIECDNCDWSWPIKDGGDDLYVCHKCGHDNTPSLNEGRYDKITNTISSKIFNQWREDYNNGAKASRLEQFFPFEGEDIEIDANISFIPEIGGLKVDGGADDQTNYIEVRFEIDPEKLPEFWEEISMNLKDVIRHEIEHLTHGEGDSSNPAKTMEDDILIRKIIDAKMLPPAQYFKLEKEVDANLQGMYLRAKKEKRAFKDVIDTYLDAQDITPEEKEEILDLWRSRLPALNLPKF